MKFNSMYNVFTKKTGLDYSRREEDVFTELEPYAVDINSGEILNKSSRPQLIKTGTVDVQKKIDSYAKDVDLYTILENFAVCGDSSIINKRVGSFGDIVNIPDNINDFTEYMDAQMKRLKSMDKDLASKVISDNVSNDELQKMIDERIKAQIIKAQESQQAPAEEVK